MIVYGDWDGGVNCSEADRLLIAAAPELLDALSVIMNLPSTPAGNGWEEYIIDSDTVRDAFAAIRKATGEQE